MEMISTILGFVVKGDSEVKVYNYSQHKAYTLSPEQFSRVEADIGVFPFFLFAAPRYADNDVVGYDGHVCMVKNGKLIDLSTGQRVHVRPIFSGCSATPSRPFRKFCLFIKHCISYEDVLHGKIDSLTKEAVRITCEYPQSTKVGRTLLFMADNFQSLRYFNGDWFRGCNACITYWEDKGESPVLSLDILRN